MSVTYDTGALIAAEANERQMWALHARALALGQRPIVPAGVLGQAWRGGPQAELSRLLRGCLVEDLSEQRSREAGMACARSGTRDVIDASVVVGALARDALVVTSDPGDLARIADGLGRRLRVHPI
ncbi:MAG: twitching motility protein PilT [Egibacteraceae bacterium]